MKNFPLLLIVFLLATLGISAFAVGGQNADKKEVTQASAQLLDHLTDEMQYLVELSDALGSRVNQKHVIDLAAEIASTTQAQNRALCQLAIAREMPIRQGLNDEHRDRLMSLMMLRGGSLVRQADELLSERYESIETMIQQARTNIADQEVLVFLDELLEVNQKLKQKIGFLGQAES